MKCHKCGAVFHFPIKKPWVLEYLLFFLPIRIYFCAKCNKSRYLLQTIKEANEFHRV
jgi:hypothetical protein